MNKNGFTLIELLAVIVVLAIVTALAMTTVLPLGGEAREKAFRVEATNAIKSATTAYEMYNLGQIKLDNSSTDKCYNSTTKNMCFTIDSLIDLGYYDMEKGTFTGSVIINTSNDEYTLNLKKNDEFHFVGYNFKDYSKQGEINNEDWQETYNSCSCSS